MGRHRGEPQQTVSSGGTTAGRHSIHSHIHVHTFPYIWHGSLAIATHPGLQSTPLDAHRDEGMSAPSFRQNYDTRDKLWPIMFQKATFPSKIYDPP